MRIDLILPVIDRYVSTAFIEVFYGREGTEISGGSKVVDLSIDLSNLFSQDCPPISYYRLVLRESLWLKRIVVRPGEQCEAGASLAVFCTAADEVPADVAARPARLMTAGIFHHREMLTGRPG